MRYAKIFLRADSAKGVLEIPVAVVTDLDIKPKKYFEENTNEIAEYYQINDSHTKELISNFSFLTDIDFSSVRLKKFSQKEALEKAFKILLPHGQKSIILKKLFELSDIPKKIDLESDLLQIKNDALQSKQFEEQKVKYFVGTDWTLEYLLGLSCLKNLFYEAILTAKLLQKSDEFELDEKEYIDAVNEIKLQVQKDFSTWEVSRMNPEEIAYKLYWETMQGKGTNKTSKAIVAQCLASLLIKEKDNSSLISQVQKDQYLKYLIDAINHVTNVQP